MAYVISGCIFFATAVVLGFHFFYFGNFKKIKLGMEKFFLRRDKHNYPNKIEKNNSFDGFSSLKKYYFQFLRRNDVRSSVFEWLFNINNFTLIL